MTKSEAIPIFQVEGARYDGSYSAVTDMSFLHMSHRYGPVTTARLLAGDVVDSGDSYARIVGMVMKEKPGDRESAF